MSPRITDLQKAKITISLEFGSRMGVVFFVITRENDGTLKATKKILSISEIMYIFSLKYKESPTLEEISKRIEKLTHTTGVIQVSFLFRVIFLRDTAHQ